jgi:shikimate kinase
MMRIYLTGMPFSGKTSIGKELAVLLQYPFIDTDEAIEGLLGYPVNEIFDLYGEKYFRNLESELIRGFKDFEAVIATGGGLPCYHDNMTYMNDTGITIYLNTPVDILNERTKFPDEMKKRPHWALLNEDDILKKMHEMLNERGHIYQQAQFEFAGSDAKSLFEMLKTRTELWK